MLTNWTEAEQRLVPAQRTLQLYSAKHPVIAKINFVASWLTEMLGPMFWAALIIAFAWAELFVG